MTDEGGRPRTPLLRLALGASVFALAAALRFAHLDFGLKHEPDYDERIFVDNTLGMISRGDWDHRFYEYPGLLLWILRVALSFGARGPDAYLVCRGVVALFSAITVVLVFRAVSGWISLRAAFVVAALLALSVIDVETAHMLRPDSVIAPFIFLALTFASPRIGSAKPTLAWVFATIATAIKFSAALVFAPLLLAAVIGRLRPARIASLCVMSVALFALLSPYTFLSGADSVAGMSTQLAYHYEGRPTGNVGASLLAFLLEVLPKALSAAGLVLAALGAWRGSREQSRWAWPWVLFPLVWILVFSTAGARYDRFIVPTLGCLCFLAAMGLETAFDKSRALAAGAVMLALVPSSLATRGYLGAIGEPTTLDQTLDWIKDTPGLRSVGTTVFELGAMQTGSVDITPLRGVIDDPFLFSQYDALVMPAEAHMPTGFRLVKRLMPTSIYNGRGIAIFQAVTPPPRLRVALGSAHVTTSAPERTPQLTDGQISTRWRMDADRGFIEVRWDKPVALSGLELVFGGTPPESELAVTARDDSGALDAPSIRPPLDRQSRDGDGLSQVLAWPERLTTSLRIELAGRPPLRVGELRFFTTALSEGKD